MNNEKNNGKGIFYGVIGVATLIVAIIGATFAYFTASQTNNGTIAGNAATISFDLNVSKITTAGDADGLIPMTDGMLEKAVTAASTKNEVCVDDTGAAVCQIYKITVTNTGSGAMFLDGYVNLTGGLGYVIDENADNYEANQATTMRWAQVFSTDDKTFTLTGTPSLANGVTISAFSTITQSGTSNINLDSAIGTGEYTFESSKYTYINKNYMRISGHKTGGASGTLDATNEDNTYTRTGDTNSALVFNQRLENNKASDTLKSKTFYVVVWLSETGTNQTAEATATGATSANASPDNFFKGNVVFLSAAGGEVSATFNGTTRRPATDNNAG